MQSAHQRGDGKNVEAALDESSRRVQRRAHLRCLIRVHVGVGQCCRAVDGESPALQAKSEHVTFHWGDGGNVAEGSKSEHTDRVASFSYTLVLVSVAVPAM